MAQTIPSQGLIHCEQCGLEALPHKRRKYLCDQCGKRRDVERQQRYVARLKANPKPRKCRSCGAEFILHGGRQWRCADCTRQYATIYRTANNAKNAEYQRRYRQRLGDAYKAYIVRRRAEKIASLSPEGLEAFRLAERQKKARLDAELKRQVYAAYGGYKCACCGATEPTFLSIDHINNDGAEMRKKGIHGRGGTNFYQWLRKNGFPAGFQVLCMNCNVSKHRNGGVCAHNQPRCNDHPERE